MPTLQFFSYIMARTN